MLTVVGCFGCSVVVCFDWCWFCACRVYWLGCLLVFVDCFNSVANFFFLLFANCFVWVVDWNIVYDSCCLRCIVICCCGVCELLFVLFGDRLLLDVLVVLLFVFCFSLFWMVVFTGLFDWMCFLVWVWVDWTLRCGDWLCLRFIVVIVFRFVPLGFGLGYLVMWLFYFVALVLSA